MRRAAEKEILSTKDLAKVVRTTELTEKHRDELSPAAEPLG
jgi:hypothetical protein